MEAADTWREGFWKRKFRKGRLWGKSFWKRSFWKGNFWKESFWERRFWKGKVRKDGFWKGSYTVEAAAVISLVFLVMGAFLICSFYIHDKNVLQGIACEAAAAGSNFVLRKEQKAAASNVRKRISAERFLGSRRVSGSTETGKKEARAEWSAVFPVPGFAMKYLTGNQLMIKKSWTSKIIDPAETIRKVRGAERLFRLESSS